MTAGRDIVTRTKISASCRGKFCGDFVSLGQWRYGVGAYFLQGISADVFGKDFQKKSSKEKQKDQGGKQECSVR